MRGTEDPENCRCETGSHQSELKRHGFRWEKYGLKNLKNTGRYYIARLVEKDGTVIDEVLIDKQSGTIQSLRGRIGAGGLKR